MSNSHLGPIGGKIVALNGSAGSTTVLFAQMQERAQSGELVAAVVFAYDKDGFLVAQQIGLNNGDMALIALRAQNWALFPD